MKLTRIEANSVRIILEGFGLRQMEGANNARFEIWLNDSGNPYFLSYFKPNDPNHFVKDQFDEILQKIA